jgi:hypothetical protein
MKARLLASLFVVMGLFVVAAILVSGCARDTDAPELQVEELSVAETEEPGDSDITLTTTDMHLEPFSDFACLDCHTDQEELVELAVEEEVVSLSEGPG